LIAIHVELQMRHIAAYPSVTAVVPEGRISDVSFDPKTDARAAGGALD